MATLPWAAAPPDLEVVNLDDLDPLWAAVPENKALVDNVRKLQEESRHVDEMYQRALVEFRQAAVTEVVQTLRAVQRVTDMRAMNEHEQLHVLCTIAEALDIPSELRAGVLAEAIEIVVSELTAPHASRL
jgi:pyruvate-formate lyase